MSTLLVCYEKGYTLEELASAFNLTICQVCQQLPHPVKLDRQAWLEISAEHPDVPIAQLADMYNTRLDIVYKMVRGHIANYGAKKATASRILDAIAKHGTEERAAHALGIKLETLQKRANMTRNNRSKYPSVEEVKAFKGTQQEAADHFKVSRSWVSKHAGTGKKKNSRPGKVKDWNEVLAYLESNSLASTAKRFNISSAAIIQWRERNGL